MLNRKVGTNTKRKEDMNDSSYNDDVDDFYDRTKTSSSSKRSRMDDDLVGATSGEVQMMMT